MTPGRRGSPAGRARVRTRARAPLGGWRRRRRLRRRRHGLRRRRSYALTRVAARACRRLAAARRILERLARHRRRCPHLRAAVARLAVRRASAAASSARVEPKATLVQTEDRTDSAAYAGVGVRGYLTERFLLQAEYRQLRDVHGPQRQRGDRRMDRRLHAISSERRGRRRRACGTVHAGCGQDARRRPRPTRRRSWSREVERRDVKAPNDRHRELRGRACSSAPSASRTSARACVYGGTHRLPLHGRPVRRGVDRLGQGRQDQLRGPERRRRSCSPTASASTPTTTWPSAGTCCRARCSSAAGARCRALLRDRSASAAPASRGDDHFTVTLGAGVPTAGRRTGSPLHVDARDQMFDSDLLGKNKLTQNLQFSLGADGLLLTMEDHSHARASTFPGRHRLSSSPRRPGAPAADPGLHAARARRRQA